MTGRLIALCSPAMGSGKSTVAQHLVDRHGYIRVAFATPLKEMAAGLLRGIGLSDSEIQSRIYGSLKESEIPVLGITSRRLQQLIGTEFGRELIRESLWTDIAIAQAEKYLTLGRDVVIDDMRFPNEYAAVTAAGGQCYRIVRPDTPVTSQHASEGQLDLVDMPEIWNAGTVADLLAAVDHRIN